MKPSAVSSATVRFKTRASIVRLSSRCSAIRLENMPAWERGTLPDKLPTFALLPADILGVAYINAQVECRNPGFTYNNLPRCCST